MKFRILLAAVMLFTIFNIGTACVCSSGGGDKDFVDLMKMVPKDSSSFTYWNIEALGEGNGYNVWEDWKNEVTNLLNDTGGIEPYEVKQFSQALIPDSGVVTIITGSFILVAIMQNLKNAGYTEDSSDKNYTLLTKDVAVALYKGKGIIVGSKEPVKNCIDIIQGKNTSHSLYEDSSIKVIADKLPGGLMTGIMRYVYNEGADDALYTNLIGIGMSVEEKNDTTLKVKVAHEFAVAGATKSNNILTKIQADLTSMDETAIKFKGSDIKASSKGDFVESSASITINKENTYFSYFSLA